MSDCDNSCQTFGQIPQPNFTQIPNVIFDYWMPKLKPSEFTVLLCLCRKIFGWHKTSDFISVSQIVKATGLTKNTALKSIESLTEQGLVLKQHHSNEWGNHPNEYALNIEKPVDEIYQSTPIRSKFGGGSAKIAPGVVQNLHPQKKDLTKERKDISKEISKSPEPDGSSHPPPKSEDSPPTPSKFEKEATEICELLKSKLLEINPNHKLNDFKKWFDTIELMLRKDGRDPKEAKELIEWVFQDDFWKTKLQSAKSLREKYDRFMTEKLCNKKSNTSALDNKKKAEEIVKKYEKQAEEKSRKIQASQEGFLIFTTGNSYKSNLIKYTENGFEDQVMSALRNWNVI